MRQVDPKNHDKHHYGNPWRPRRQTELIVELGNAAVKAWTQP
jgi:hypothetical protein